jgi:hypothetical protein
MAVSCRYAIECSSAVRPSTMQSVTSGETSRIKWSAAVCCFLLNSPHGFASEYRIMETAKYPGRPALAIREGNRSHKGNMIEPGHS